MAQQHLDDTLAAMARRLLADAPPRFNLVGHSMGGYLAFEVLRQAGDRVAKLVLMNTQAGADNDEQRKNRRAQIEQAQAGHFEAVVRGQFPKLVDASRADDRALLEQVLAMARTTGADGYVRQQQAILSRVDSRPDLPRIATPTLVLVGSGDVITPLERAREMSDAIPGATLAVIDGAGHYAALEAPERVNDALVGLLTA